jgi:hypothetical protein
MKKVRLAMMVTAMFLGITTVARAQDQQRGGRPNMTAMLLKDITLSPVQQARMDSIQTKYREQMQTARQGGDREAMRSLMEKQRDEMKAVLTDDQKKTFDKNMEDMRASRRPQNPPSDR